MSNIYQIFAQHVQSQPDKVALVFEQHTVSYQALNTKVLKLCTHFYRLGLQPGQRVALFAPNGLEYPIVMLAAARLGLAIVPLPISLKGDALSVALKKTPVAAVIAWPSIGRTLLADAVIEPANLLSLSQPVADEPCWQDIMSEELPAQAINIPEPQVDINAPFILTMTSGSTGQPKPIVLSQQCKISRAFDATIRYYGLTSDEVVLVATPLYHSLAQRGVLMPLMLGATSVILPKFTLPKWLEAIKTHQVSFLFAVSAQLESLLSSDEEMDLSSLRCVVSSSAVLAGESKQALLKKLPCRLHECYGASEVGVVSDFCVSERRDKNGAVGAALPFVQVKILDKERRTLDVGEVGEIACQTTTGFSGYLKMLQQTQDAYDSEGYFLTGDLGYLDEDGFLYYVGRKKEVISSGGINIFPQDIEAVIKKHPKVIDCVAFGCADRQLGEYIKVVYEQLGDLDISRELRLLCLAELTDYQQPRVLECLSALPRNPMGKVLRNDVKMRYSDA
ncbi:class I adenylate-forming enzyme family protein [Pseudoalteromonas rubra]|uniref:Long-chain fatty acid--CoA ligase n=1 Tax=Pseudoalteromonas rubra TaxID=43658 RepID=A0A5S3WVW1_9GAMM|nr:class I adenylate-forming enzyme family protein [Pseudoalteromonas rubra]TMP33865.1 long-chain fatty acid--CoA ligase [Pseudoalteromonas rubra]